MRGVCDCSEIRFPERNNGGESRIEQRQKDYGIRADFSGGPQSCESLLCASEFALTRQTLSVTLLPIFQRYNNDNPTIP